MEPGAGKMLWISLTERQVLGGYYARHNVDEHGCVAGKTRFREVETL